MDFFSRNSPQPDRHPSRRFIAMGAAGGVLALTVGFALAPPKWDNAWAAYPADELQTVQVTAQAPAPAIDRDDFSATPGYATLARSGTNYDWAKMVLLMGGWPMSDDNVTVITRWMRQENGPESWWNRNNPLNNGWGSGGGSGTGSYNNLVTAAQNAAEALHTLGGYAGIRNELADGSEPGKLEHAIWYSPWAGGHYAYGGHWSHAPVPKVKAPAGAWGPYGG